ncbi:hemagglutinin repeat-containing protein, partial [Providencia rettgeri]
MNKQCYRVIFNRARQMLMVVSELAKNHSADKMRGSQPGRVSHLAVLRPISLSLGLLFGSITPVWAAGVVADGSASGNQQPTIIAGANGTPQVNIQSPNSSGVSHNKYQNFDVDKNGVILNNSAVNTQTQLGGLITGNPWLAKGEASVILNEVNSANPSQLNGFVEVAGKRADVIIANPAGITCNGCGFINANKTTLAAAQVLLEQGKIAGFDVKNGQIAIHGNGLNDEHSDYTQLIARAVKINAKLHAKDLSVTTGKNRTDANGNVLSTELDAEETPEFAVDVASLGGMYANKIRLVGTEKGVGVRNAGHLGAQAGDFTLNANGKLINTGIITASQDTAIALNGNLTNQGNVTAGKKLTLTTPNDIDNTGNLVAGNNLSITGQNVVSRQGSLLGAGINAEGKVTQSGSLTVNTTQSQSLNGKTIAHDDITLTGSALSLSGSQTQGKNLTLNSQSTLSTQHATVNATGDLTLTATHWDNTQGQVVANKAANLRGQGLHVINRDGEVKAGTTLNLTAEQIDGEGKWLSLNDMNLTVKNDVHQTGQWIANNTLNVTSSGHITNEGQVSAKALTVNSADFTNQTAGEVLADTLHIQTQNTLTNTGLLNGNQVVLKTNHLSNRGTGRIYGDQIAIAAATLDNVAENDKSAVIASRGDLDLGVGTLNNTTHSLLFSEGDFTLGGALDANYRATGRADTVNNHSAYLESLGNMFLTLTHLNNINDHFVTELQLISQTLINEYQIWGERFDITKYTIYRDHDEVDFACLEGRGCDDNFQTLSYIRTIEETRIKETDPAKIVAGKNLTIDASGTVTNDKSQIVAGNTLDIQAATLNNIDVPGERHITDVGTIEYWYRVRHKGNDSQGWDKSDYAPGTKIEAITLYPSTLEEHQQTSPTTNETPADYDSTQNPSAVVTQPPVVTLPDNSLFTVKPGSDSDYLIETDPQFTNRKQWLGTDYMQKAMLSDANLVHKRLGDGYYEQRLIREQVIALSGQRYLEGYADDEAQFQALMDAGLRAQSAFNLRPGIALSAEQMDNLTENMVWLVSRDVTLPDGTVETVLVPQVYLKKDSLQLDGSGALLSGQKIQLAVNEDVTNSGRLIGDDVSVFANNITQQSGHVQGDTVTLSAKNDLTQHGGSVQANDALTMVAGNNLTIGSTTRDTENQAGNNQFSSTYLSDQASVYVGGKDGKLTLQAGNDVTLAAAAIGAQGENSQITVEAGRNLQLSTVKTQASEYTEAGSNHRITRTSSQDIGSSVQGNGTVTLNAGQDITATAATVSAGKALTVTAGRDITVAAGEQNQTHDEYHKVTGGNGALSKTTTETQFTYDRTTANSSTLSGDNVTLASGRDTTVSGSNVMADNDVTVQAGRDLTVTTADENNTEHYYKKETTSGITSSGGLGFTVGKQSVKQTTDTDSNQKKGSVIGSTAGNVTLTAGNTATIHGSDVIAAKDINVMASDINITAAENTRTDVTTTETKSSGLSVSLGGSVGSALNTAYQTGKAAQETDDGQLKALQGIKAGLKLEQANQAGQLAAAQNPGSDMTNNGSFGVDVSYGSSSSKSTSKTEQKTASGSSLTAGDNLTLNATGKAADSQGNIHVQGSTLNADKDLTLNAKNDINLSSATNTQTVDSK